MHYLCKQIQIPFIHSQTNQGMVERLPQNVICSMSDLALTFGRKISPDKAAGFQTIGLGAIFYQKNARADSDWLD